MIPLIDKPNVHGSDSEYPYGDVRDQSMTEAGTPLNAETHGDFHQFFEKMFAESGLVANFLRDNEYNGWQLWEALQKACQNQRRYKRYYVNLTQTATGAPTQDAQFENDLSTSPGFSYVGVGQYNLTFGASEFPIEAKVAKWATQMRTGETVEISRLSATQIRINTYDATGAAANGVLTFTSIFIRVYP